MICGGSCSLTVPQNLMMGMISMREFGCFESLTCRNLLQCESWRVWKLSDYGLGYGPNVFVGVIQL